MLLKNVLTIVGGIALFASCVNQPSATVSTDDSAYDQRKADSLGIPKGNKLSAAMKRAMEWPQRDNSWFFEYKMMPLKGDLAYEEGIVRRDPSAMIKVGDKYYVWYSKSYGETQGFAGDVENEKVFPWDRCDIWYATSKDGITWKEEGVAVKRGEKGAYDDRSVFTPEVMQWNGKYYLCYQTVKSPYTVRVKENVAMAWADSPDGPWEKTDKPVLTPSDNGVWEGEEDNRFKVKAKGDFDSHKVHDPCIIPYNGKFYLYYKGERMGEEITWGGREIKHGVAYGEPHVPMRTRRKYAGKKAKIKAIEQLTGNVMDTHLSTSEINAYIGQYIFGTSQWAEYHRLFEYFASELEQVPEPVELKFLVIVEFDEAMCRPDDDRLIYMVKQALENNSIDIYRGLQNPIITFSIQAIDNK